MDEGRLIGVVSERDLFSLQRLGLGEITMELRLAADIAALAGLAAEIRKLTGLLVEQGVSPEQLTLFVSVLNDRLSQRVLEIVRKRYDLERISWCWLAFGSEGRWNRRLPPTRTTVCCSRRTTGRRPRRCANGCFRMRAR